MTLHEVYQRNAARFDRERDTTLFEKTWLDRFCDRLPRGGCVLDLGCGSGRPIAQYLVERGFGVVGVDFSDQMIALARSRFPTQDWIVDDMRYLDMGRTFDGVLGWNSFFHLTAQDQHAVLPRMARHLRPGGVMMLTVGPEEGEAWGTVGDDPVYHASLSPAEYRARLWTEQVNVEMFVANDPECHGHSVLLAKKGLRHAKTSIGG